MESSSSRSAAADGGPRILSVSELNGEIKHLLGGLGRIAVEGEVASLRRPASGHLYFNLKDRRQGFESLVNCAIWRSQVQRALKKPLEEGEQVIAHGKLDVYAPRGSYSLIVERVERRGLGALLAELEELKRELAAAGWFERKRPLPPLPGTIGVVTSRDGAAFQDFLRTRSLRWPMYPVRLVHTPVQGPGAAREIGAALAALDASGVDLIVLCRGGGSLEDLWAFNERPVAEAIWNSSVPVVSAVGHETDVTLADHVADLRAHTPTDAAQTVIPDRRELEEVLERQFNYLLAAVDDSLARREEAVERAGKSRSLSDPARILESRKELLAGLEGRLSRALGGALQVGADHLEALARTLAAHAPARRLEREEERLAAFAHRLGVPAREGLAALDARLELASGRLEAFSPFAVLRRGYSITRPACGGAPLVSAEGLPEGAELETILAEGRVLSRVEALPDSDGSEAP